MFAKLSPRDTMLLVLLLCVLAVVGWWFLYYQSREQLITDTQTQLDDSATTLATSRSAANALPALRTEVAGLQTQRDTFFQALPQTQNIGSVVAAIQQSVGAVGGDLTNLTVAPGANTGLPAGVRPISLNMSVNAKFQPTFQLLRAVETMSRFSTVSALSLNLPAPDSLDPSLASTLTMTVYTFDPVAAGGTAGSPAAAPAAPAAPTAPAGGAR
ncbi:type 4a pilus biogenesis protein PilO [Deinococcus altitudinis]|uniref:type 4a pilus biogenesis protein PilO n=1 Tax=Deinococcus altitudinis TaxID=468914 RepID=UPI0038923FEA